MLTALLRLLPELCCLCLLRMLLPSWLTVALFDAHRLQQQAETAREKQAKKDEEAKKHAER
jgi:hypothetical protein